MLADSVQTNSCNPMSDNLEFMIIQHLKKIVPRPDVLIVTRKRCNNETGRSQGHVQQERQCTYDVTLRRTHKTNFAVEKQ
jgi:hypothetical protein